jgi:hypothetical protein
MSLPPPRSGPWPTIMAAGLENRDRDRPPRISRRDSQL